MLHRRNPQLNQHGELIHLLSTEGLSREILTHILDTAAQFVSVSDREVKKVPLLRGKSVFNLFFENSTRILPQCPCASCLNHLTAPAVATRHSVHRQLRAWALQHCLPKAIPFSVRMRHRLDWNCV